MKIQIYYPHKVEYCKKVINKIMIEKGKTITDTDRISTEISVS